MRSTLAAAAATVLALSVSGCISESADLGQAPPVGLATPQLALAPPAQAARGPAARAKVLQAMTDVGAGDLQSVRVRIYARSARDADGLRRLLVGVGADPARLTVEPGHWRADRLVLTRAIAETAPCAGAVAPVDPDDPLPSLMSLARCTQSNNLANMLVDPGDLVAPPRLAAEDGEFIVDGVDSWRKNRTTGLPTQDTSTYGSGAGGGSGTSGGGGTAVPATGGTGAGAASAGTPAAASPGT